jgi:hypothetical protein
MAETTKAQLAELQKEVDAKFDRVKSTDLGDGPKFQQIANALDSLAVDTYLGTVAFAGQTSTGSFEVQFNSGNSGYSSFWPQWAFGLAQSALLSGKSLFVVANGLPFGSNLLTVLIWGT